MHCTCAVLLSVVCPAVQYFFPSDFTKGTIFGIKLLNIKYVCVIFCTNLSGIFCILRRTERDMNKNVYWSSCTLLDVPVRC